jgi:thymidylate synthase
MNNLDLQYQNLLRDIIDHGTKKTDRTGTGTISLFGKQIRHNMSEGFPLLTTKRMAWKSMVTELIWFLKGDTNIKFLLDHNCNIWTGDAYKRYKKYAGSLEEPDMNVHVEDINESKIRIMTESEFVDSIKNWEEFASKWGDLGPIYGKQWRQWGGLQDLTDDDKPIYLDQISNLIKALKTDPDSRRLMVSAWNVEDLSKMVLPPCHYGFQIYTRKLTGGEMWKLLADKVGMETFNKWVDDIVPFGGGLSWELETYKIPNRAISLMWNQRSVDTFLGLPFNIASYGLLLEIIAKEVNMMPDQLIGNLGDTHLYLNHIEQANEQLTRESFELPRLMLPDMEGQGIFDYHPTNIEIWDYKSHPSIKAPLSN